MARVDGVIDGSWRERAVDAEALAVGLAEGEAAIMACRADVARLDDELRQADLGRAPAPRAGAGARRARG